MEFSHNSRPAVPTSVISLATSKGHQKTMSLIESNHATNCDTLIPSLSVPHYNSFLHCRLIPLSLYLSLIVFSLSLSQRYKRSNMSSQLPLPLSLSLPPTHTPRILSSHYVSAIALSPSLPSSLKQYKFELSMYKYSTSTGTDKLNLTA